MSYNDIKNTHVYLKKSHTFVQITVNIVIVEKNNKDTRINYIFIANVIAKKVLKFVRVGCYLQGQCKMRNFKFIKNKVGMNRFIFMTFVV